jgi:hypothetical protein
MPGFKNFRCARLILGGIEINAYDRQGPDEKRGIEQTPAQQFYSLTA